MRLTQDLKKTVDIRISADPAFAEALLEEVAMLYLQGDASSAKAALHNLVTATVGYERLAIQLNRPRTSLQRMLSRSGRLTMSSLAAIFQTLKDAMHVNIQTMPLGST